MTSFVFHMLSLIIPRYVQVHSHNIKKHQNGNYWAQVLNMDVKKNPRTCFSNPGIFSLNDLESFKLIQLTIFFFFTSWKSYVVLDPSKHQSVHLSLKYQAQQR